MRILQRAPLAVALKDKKHFYKNGICACKPMT
jgi:hypothetical protein